MQSLTKKEKLANANSRSKWTKGLLKKTANFIRTTGLEAITVLKDIKGNYIMLGSKEFEQLVMERKPLVDTRKHSLHEQRYKGIITVISICVK